MTTNTWLGTTTADWTTAADWSTGGVTGAPAAGNDLVIGKTSQLAAFTVTISTDLSGTVYNSLLISSSTTNAARATTVNLSTVSSALSVTGGIVVGRNSQFTGQGAVTAGGAISGIGTVLASGGVLVLGGAGSLSTLTLLNTIGANANSTLELNMSGGAGAALGIQTLASTETLWIRQQLYTITTAYTIAGGTLQLGSATTLGTIDFASALTLTLSGNGLITGAGKIGANTTFAGANGGTILASGGTLDIAAAQTVSETYNVANSSASVLQLDGAIASGSTVSFVGSSGTIFDALGTALSGRVISGGFTGSDAISVTGANSFVFTNNGVDTTVTVKDTAGGAGATIETFTIGGLPTNLTNGLSVDGSSFTAACYLSGTRILTDRGEVLVEELAVDDLVVTADFGPQPVRWIGRRAYLARLVNEHHRAALMPVRIAAGALADNVPTRDLFVSPEHMIAMEGVLVVAHNLVNSSTITRFEDLDVVKYFHIELDQHAVIFADGAPAESYLDTGNRNMFTNVLEYAELGMPVGSTVPCLPIVSEGPELAAIRIGIADRATACGFTTSADADLHLQVDGAIVYPSAISGHSFSFDIAQSVRDVRIISRSAAPADINPASADGRRLGVAVAGLTLRGSGMSIEVLAGDKLLTDGFYQADGGHRWTNGSAHVPAALLALMDGAFSVSVQLVGTDMQYPVAAQGDIVALASARVARNSVDQRLVA